MINNIKQDIGKARMFYYNSLLYFLLCSYYIIL